MSFDTSSPGRALLASSRARANARTGTQRYRQSPNCVSNGQCFHGFLSWVYRVEKALAEAPSKDSPTTAPGGVSVGEAFWLGPPRADECVFSLPSRHPQTTWVHPQAWVCSTLPGLRRPVSSHGTRLGRAPRARVRSTASATDVRPDLTSVFMAIGSGCCPRTRCASR